MKNFNNLFNTLKEEKWVVIPIQENYDPRQDFVTFCQEQGVQPLGGAFIFPDEGNNVYPYGAQGYYLD